MSSQAISQIQEVLCALCTKYINEGEVMFPPQSVRLFLLSSNLPSFSEIGTRWWY